MNGLKKILRDFKLKYLVPGSGLVSVVERWAWCALPRGVVATLRGQSGDLVTAPRNENGSVVIPDQNLMTNFVYNQVCIGFDERLLKNFQKGL